MSTAADRRCVESIRLRSLSRRFAAEVSAGKVHDVRLVGETRLNVAVDGTVVLGCPGTNY